MSFALPNGATTAWFWG